MQDAAIDLADAQAAAAEAQQVSFIYQQELAKFSKALFVLGVANITANRIVVRELELRLKGASEEIGELAIQEMYSVIAQLKAKEDVMQKQSELSDKVLRLHNQISQIEKDLIAQGKHLTNHEQRLVKSESKLESNTSLLSQHTQVITECWKRLNNNEKEIKSQASKLSQNTNERINKKTEKTLSLFTFITSIIALILSIIQFFV